MMRDWAKFAGFSAILAFVLVASFCFALQAPIQKNEGASQNEQQSPLALSKTAPEPWFVVFRAILPGGLQTIANYCNSHSEEQKKKWPQAYYCDVKVTDTYLAFFTGLLFLVTAGLVGVTGGLIWTAIRQENMARTHERAYVSGGGPVPRMDNTGKLVEPDEGWVTVQNYGRTPAFMKRFEWGFCNEADFPKDRKLSEIIDRKLIPAGLIRVHERQDIWPPNTQTMFYFSIGSFSLSEQNGKLFFGRYIYEDVFHDRHHSTFVLKLGPAIGQSDPIPGGYSDWS